VHHQHGLVGQHVADELNQEHVHEQVEVNQERLNV
jgi:hypothetical protein